MRYMLRDLLNGLGFGLLAGLLLLPLTAHADDLVVGQVTAVSGRATAQRAGQERLLACGDFVYAADQVVTAKGASLSMLLGDVLTELPSNSALSLGATPANTADATLDWGRVRMIDPRMDGAPVRLAALDTETQVIGNDVEAYILSEKVGPYAMFCEWDAPLAAMRADEQLTCEAGQCVIAKPTEPLYLARAHEDRIPVAAAEQCGPDPAILAGLAGDPTRHLTPGDVAAPPPGIRTAGNAGLCSFNPDGPTLFGVYQCDSPNAGCSALPQGSLPPVILEPVPLGGTAPGSLGPLLRR